MKQFLFLLILILPITILSQNNINLKLTLSIGDKYLIERELNSVTTQDVMGEIQIIKKNDSSFYDFEIINKPTDSSYYIKITFKRIKSDFTVTDETIGFDTDSIDAEIEDLLENLFISFIDKDIYFLVTDKGKHIRTDSLEQLYRSFETMHGSDSETVNLFKKMINKDFFKTLIPLSVFPDNKKIKLNDSWVNTDTSFTGILKTVYENYVLDKVTEDSYNFSIYSDIETDKNTAISSNNIFLFYDLTGTIQGTEICDIETCMLISSKISQNASGDVSMKYVESSDPAYTWPIRIQNTIKTKVTKINSNED